MKNSLICNYLDELFPEPKCELNFSTDYELLIAVVLSAQSTDKRVNECTKILYKKYVIMHMYQWLTIEAKSTSQKSLQLDCFIRTIDTPIFNTS